jgi:RHS repeat-associated protein
MALSLVMLQIVPMSAWAAEAKRPPKPMDKPVVRPNRTVPTVVRRPAVPHFSSPPLDVEFGRARVFDEPLVPLPVAADQQEDSQLAGVVLETWKASGEDRMARFEAFVSDHPDSRWNGSLLLGLGIVYRRSGYFTRALDSWERSWNLLKNETDPRLRALADRAVGELAELEARLGRYEQLERLFAELGSRDVRGSASQKVAAAHEGYSVMQKEPERAFLCGPFGLDRILASVRQGYVRDPKIAAAKSTRRGTSMLQVLELADSVGFEMQIARRDVGAPVIVPALVHWKAGHFAALTKESSGRFLLQDPTFGDDLWITRAALEDEATGYFLVPAGSLPSGWQRVPRADGNAIWGKGVVNSTDPTVMGPNPAVVRAGGNGAPGQSCPPMAVYTVDLLLLNLHISDSPVGYTPAIGPGMRFTIAYNQREQFQPQIPLYSNFGAKWTFDWFSYVEDDPADDTKANVYLRQGGMETYTGMSGVTPSLPNYRSQAVLIRTASGTYRRELSDGSVELFDQPDGATAFPRRFYATKYIDSQGHAIELAWSYEATTAGERLASIKDALGQYTTFAYESADPLKVTKVTDPFGRYATFAYYPDGRLQRITDVNGIQSEFAYGLGDFIGALTTPYGTTGFVTGQGWLETADPLGGKERFEFALGNVELLIPRAEPVVPQGMPVFNTYLDARNTFYWDKRAMATMGTKDYTKAHIYHWLHSATNTNVASGILESEKLPLEGRVWYNYPGQGHPALDGSAASPTFVGRVLDDGTTQLRQYEYNSRGRKTKEVDPLGRETRYTYGTNNTPDPDPTTGTGIDLLKVERKNGASYDILQTLTYDTKHRPLTRTDESGQTTTYTYNGQGQIETVTMPPRAGITENRTTTYSYDAFGFLQTLTGPATGLTSSFTYDAYGRLRTATDPEGYTTTYDYDALDRMTKATYPDGTYEEAVYNRLDREKRRDRLGRWTQTFHDALRRIVATRDPLGRTTTRQWCTCGSLDKLIDPNGNAISWARDLQGRVTQESRADGSDVDFVYENTTSRLKQVTDAKSQVVGYEYFADGDLKQVTHTNPQNPTANVSFTYDVVYNRPATMMDGVGTTTYTYHPVTVPPTLGSGRLASVDGPLANDTITYSYDELGRRTGRAVNSVATTQSYDTLGRVAAEATPIGTFNYSYVAATARLTSITYPNGQATEYSYLGNLGDHRLQEIHNRLSGGATLSRFQYTFEADGTMKTWTQQADASPARVYELGYDSADQLTSAILKTTDPTPAILKRFVYDYDKAGNRTTEQIDDSAVAATYNNMDELLGQQPGGALRFGGTVNEPATVTVQGKPAQVTADNRFTGSASLPSGTSSVEVRATDPSGNVRTNTYQVSLTGASKSFSYDANGNLISDGSRSFEWDAEDRLLAVTLGTHRSEFAYDGRGRRVRIIEKEGGQVTDDRWLLWCDERICEERDSGGGVVRKRFFDRGLQDDGISYYYAKDHLGSMRELTDSSGAIRARYDYDPYGRVTKVLGDRDTPFRFIGSYFHSPSSLTLTLYRAYDSGMGRWISQDPAGPVDGTNLYGYVQNDPVNFIDPSGLFKIDDSIRKVRTFGIGQVCPPTAAGACTTGYAAILFCPCTDESTCPEAGSRVENATLKLYGTMYIFSGPWPLLKKTAKDKTVKDAASAEAHEYNFHINPSIAAVAPLIEELESKTFDSQAECQAACGETAAKVNKLFAETMKKTQQQENKMP